MGPYCNGPIYKLHLKVTHRQARQTVITDQWHHESDSQCSSTYSPSQNGSGAATVLFTAHYNWVLVPSPLTPLGQKKQALTLLQISKYQLNKSKQCSIIYTHTNHRHDVKMFKNLQCHFFVFNTFSFDVICDLLMNRRTATWNLFVNFTIEMTLKCSQLSWNHEHQAVWPLRVQTMETCC